MIFKSKIFRRFLTAYLPVALAPLIIISGIALWFGRIEIRDQTFRQLQMMADSAEAQVLDYLNYLKIQTSGYSKSRPIMDALKKRHRRTGNNHIAGGLNRYLAAGIKNFPECVEMFVLDVNGRVIASSDASNTGKDHSETDYFFNGRKAVYVSNIFREEETGRITWLVSCPVTDVRGNRLLAVLVSRIDPVTLSDITTERKVRALGAKSQALRAGETGETYLVNRDNLMITESRFQDDVILKQTVNTELVRCTRKISDTKAGNYTDYRGVPVDGASMIIWETGWLIISETDFKESMIPFQRLLTLCFAGIGALVPLIFCTSWMLSRRLIRPIVRLVLADREIIQGDPSRAFISEGEIPADELGEVMRIRNIMLASLKQNEKAVRESEERYRLLFNSGDDAIFVAQVTADGMPGKFIEVNEIACKRLGYTKDELLTMSPAGIDAPDMAGRRIAALKDLPLKKNIVFEMAHIARDGKRIPVEINVAYIEYKGRSMYLGIARDITERKDAEDKLKQHVNDLERFRKVTIQREIRMRELKDRVAALEAEIDRLKDTGNKPL